MSLARKILDIFCNNSTGEIGIFGSKYNGSSDTSVDPDDIQRGSGGNNTNWANGWSEAIISNQAPCLEDMNGVMYVLSYMTKYLYQTGLADWNSNEGYGLYAMTQYGGILYMSIQVDPLYNNLNINHNPSSSPTWWRPMIFATPWVAGNSYNVGDIVNYKGKNYKCVANHTASSLFETDFYTNKRWDDGNPAGTILYSFGSATTPYGYFNITGDYAGREIPQATYPALYQIIGTSYNNCINFSTGTNYANPSAGNFRLPDLRGSFFKGTGGNNYAKGHNASHTHVHNFTATQNLTHGHAFQNGKVPYSWGATEFQWHYSSGTTSGKQVWTVAPNTAANLTATSPTSMSIPALNIHGQGSGNAPEPDYYGIKVLLKH